MLYFIEDTRLAITISIAFVLLMNILLCKLHPKFIKNQMRIEVEEHDYRFDYLSSILNIITWISLGYSWANDGELFVFLGGGYLISSLVIFIITVQSFLYLNLLSRKNLSSGIIKQTHRFNFLDLTHMFSTIGLLFLILFIIFGEKYLLGAFIFLIIDATGFYRRSRQTRKQPSKPSSTPDLFR